MLKKEGETLAGHNQELNKSRDEMASYVAKKDKENKQLERRFQDKVEVIEKLTKEREEQDKAITSLKDKVAALESDAKTRRADFDSQRRLLQDRVSNLDKQLSNALDGKKTSTELVISLDKQVSTLTVDIINLRQKETENMVRLNHQ